MEQRKIIVAGAPTGGSIMKEDTPHVPTQPKEIAGGVEDDMRIWKHKVHRADPVFCEADKELGEFRRWVKQFYSDPA